MVKEYKGSHSGEHGDGLVRSEFHEMMYGRKTVELFEEVKDRFDPAGLMNPGKIVRAPRMNDRTLFRYKPDYARCRVRAGARLVGVARRGRRVPGRRRDVQQQRRVPQARRRRDVPELSRHAATRRDVTRGRANTLRLAISGQLGPDALASRRDAETLKLCVSCKALPARMPDRRRHGAHEDRGAGRAQQAARAVAARPARRLPAALCVACASRFARPAQPARCHSRRGAARRAR